MINAAIGFLEAAEPTATGATLMMPDGETIYLDADAVRAVSPGAVAPPSRPIDLTSAVEALQNEGRGLLHVDVVRREDTPRLIAAAARGDGMALVLLRAANNALRNMLSAPANEPARCACCSRSTDDGRFALAIVTPGISAPKQALALAICATCATTEPGIRAKAAVALRQIWPDARPINIHHANGGLH